MTAVAAKLVDKLLAAHHALAEIDGQRVGFLGVRRSLLVSRTIAYDAAREALNQYIITLEQTQ